MNLRAKKLFYVIVVIFICSCGPKLEIPETMDGYFLSLPISEYSGMNQEDLQTFLDNCYDHEVDNEKGYLKVSGQFIDEGLLYVLKTFSNGEIVGRIEFIEGGDCSGYYSIDFFEAGMNEWKKLEGVLPDISYSDFWNDDVPEKVKVHENFIETEYSFNPKNNSLMVSLYPSGSEYCFEMAEGGGTYVDSEGNIRSEFGAVYAEIENRDIGKMKLDWNNESKIFEISEKISNEKEEDTYDNIVGKVYNNSRDIIRLFDSLDLATYGEYNDKMAYRLHKIKNIDGEYKQDPCGSSGFFISMGSEQDNPNTFLESLDKKSFPIFFNYSPFDTYEYSIKEAHFLEPTDYVPNTRIEIKIKTIHSIGVEFEDFVISYEKKLKAWVYNFSDNTDMAHYKDIKDLEEYPKEGDCYEGESEEQPDPYEIKFMDENDFDPFEIKILEEFLDVKWIEVDGDNHEKEIGSEAYVIFKKDEKGYYYFHNMLICNFNEEIDALVTFCEENRMGGECYSIYKIDENILEINSWNSCASINDNKTKYYKKVE